MKKIISFFMVILMILSLLGCDRMNTSNNRNNVNLLDQNEFAHILFSIEDRPFRTEWGSAAAYWPLMGPIPDQNTALAAALMVFEMRRTEPSFAEYTKNFVPKCITYYKGNGVWTVSFSEPWPEGVFIIGGDFAIALRESDGKVLNLFWGE